MLLPLAVVLATACGPTDAGEAEPAAYAQAVCSGLSSWQQGIAGDSAELTRSLQAATAVPAVRARYTGFYAATVRRTDALLGTVRQAGAPAADHGLGYARDLTAALVRTRAGLADAQARFAALPTGDLRSYAAGAATVRDSLGTLFTEVGGTLDRLGGTYTDSSLNSAFRDEPACQRLAGG